MSRPEHSFAPDVFYDESEAKKYSTSSRMLNIQREITNRAIELLNLDDSGPKLLLDVGCGSGLSGQVIAQHGHSFIGLDISPSMLKVAHETLEQDEGRERRSDDDDDDEMDDEEDEEMEEENDEEDSEEMDENDDEDEPEDDGGQKSSGGSGSRRKGKGDLILHDMGQGLNFRPNSFDGCVSISAVQWLCNSYNKSQIPFKRLRTFFSTLYSVLRRGSRAVIQLYPETPQQMEMITSAAMAAGFTGGVVVDYPNSAKAKKFYLVLFAGGSSSGSQQLPRALGTTAKPQENIAYEKDRIRKGKLRKRDNKNQPATKSREWILNKKDRQRKQGKEVRKDSKYTGRRRKGGF